MWQKGISLTSEGCALIYLVDSAGTRTTSDMINIDLNTDYISPVFHQYAQVHFNVSQLNTKYVFSPFC